ncbi:MAG: sugar phosphate isomerase/epimerase [Gammaproteobacteria bacterium]|nr:sugar phosphate isomerase/epimerase [Gammaproteobacteria bacterium]
MKLSLCNEVIRELDFREQCAFAHALGYDGLEVAPFTLAQDPQQIEPEDAARLRAIAEDEGVEITGLHWLLVSPRGLSITSDDKSVQARTQDHLIRLIYLCAELGGTVLVHGSPAQRRVKPGESWETAYARAREMFRAIAETACDVGVTYCIEPLSTAETSFINHLEEALRLVDDVGQPCFRTMIDTSAAGQTEEQPVADLIRRWMPSGKVAHIQFNDSNRRGPGQGEDDFLPILQALSDTGYDGVISMEPFIYEPDGPTVAKESIRYVRALMERLV